MTKAEQLTRKMPEAKIDFEAFRERIANVIKSGREIRGHKLADRMWTVDIIQMLSQLCDRLYRALYVDAPALSVSYVPVIDILGAVDEGDFWPRGLSGHSKDIYDFCYAAGLPVHIRVYKKGDEITGGEIIINLTELV